MKSTKLLEASIYLDHIKKYAHKDIAHIQNNVLNKNPYTSDFIKNYFFNKNPKNFNYFFILKKILVFYLKSSANLIIFLARYFIFKFFGTNSSVDFEKNIFVIDIFFLTDKIIKDEFFKDQYFSGLYEVLTKKNIDFVFVPRLYGLGKNPFKFKKLLRVLNNDKVNKYILQYELLSLTDLMRIAIFIFKYPLKQFQLIQRDNSYLDQLFNYELFNCLPNTSFESYVRYLVGMNLAKKLSDGSKVISWQEFQNLEKSFYKALRESNKKITIYGCEFLIKYENYLSMHITDIDVDLLVTPHKTLLNGKYNYSKSLKHNFENGISLRYKEIFRFVDNNSNDSNLLALLGQDVSESKSLLNTISHVDNLNIKLHPASYESQFNGYLKPNWNYINGDIYELFKKSNIVFVSTMTGTALEAVACGISVIIISSKNRFNVNPLVSQGYRKIWDIAFDNYDLKVKMDALLNFRENNSLEIESISKWYKDNFFIEPTEKNILKAFDL